MNTTDTTETGPLPVIDHARVYETPNGYYTTGGRFAVLCADCAPTVATRETIESEWAPMGWAETDYPTHCDRCQGLIFEPLTSDGRHYVETLMAEGPGDDWGARVLLTWAVAYGYDVTL